MRGVWEPKQGQAATADPQSPLGKLHIPLRVSLVSTRLSEKSSKRKKAHSVSLESLPQWRSKTSLSRSNS